ncbi:MAG: ribonuclease III [Corallococcus sp.]|nr:ribonuclease III [Corallococcus sp.]MCM1359463.1 ribonuclease III [Corallococcus sp.]MCM1394725.1 ribonuclease III [Corallococcus sp.]
MTVKDFNPERIESKIGYTFRDKSLLKHAFVHSSYANAQNIADNERMEFFGDAILDMIVSEYLYKKYPKCNAGELTQLRAELVSADGLRPVVIKLGILDDLLVYGTSAKIHNLSRKIEANLYEAVLCAVYFDGGMDAAVKFVMKTLKKGLDNVLRVEKKDYKTRVQEYCQQRHWPVEYQLEIKTGPDNKPNFTYSLLVDGVPVSKGSGSSIKAAQQVAAKKLVEEWRID